MFSPHIPPCSVFADSMPPSTAKMPPLKPVVMAASKPQFINIPRVSPLSGSYRCWLANLLSVPHNKKVFAKTEKAVVDALFQAQAAKQFTSDNNKLKQAMDEVRLTIFHVE